MRAREPAASKNELESESNGDRARKRASERERVRERERDRDLESANIAVDLKIGIHTAPDLNRRSLQRDFVERKHAFTAALNQNLKA